MERDREGDSAALCRFYRSLPLYPRHRAAFCVTHCLKSTLSQKRERKERKKLLTDCRMWALVPNLHNSAPSGT
ncbi:hypothetical protein JZ751_011684 [Albula glossodonta]|uniref:Uncharacterized protein n=1 Tax=Albula glossodonta TaxID=121402 RepID=A0A8T2PQC8_9TELE|nr:hypothetical protein JZ751_011684 [Albula glossodonta]